MGGRLRLTGRYFRGVPLDRVGTVEEPLELDAARTAFVALHCWNIGCPEGPPVDNAFRVGMGFAETIEAADAVVRDYILPAMQAARRAGILVAHVENLAIGRKHLDLMDVPPTVTHTQIEGPVPPPAVPGHAARVSARAHGEGYAKASPYAHMDRIVSLMPEPGEPFAMDSLQLHRALSPRGIENLVYTGFATDMCVLDSGGGVKDMAQRFGYRVFLIREGTLGLEFPGELDARPATKFGIRRVETQYGHTVAWDDWMAQCAALATGAET